MQGLAQAQRQFDRQVPTEVAEAAQIDVMASLRVDLGNKNDAGDVSSAFFDHLVDGDADVKMLRALADGNDAAVLAIAKAALRAVAEKRALR